MAKVLEFFFDYSSPYSYLASTRVEAVVRRAGADLRWRPLLLGALFKESGNTSPASNIFKARYMLKDLFDWTRHYDLPDFVLPEGFPSGWSRMSAVAFLPLPTLCTAKCSPREKM